MTTMRKWCCGPDGRPDLDKVSDYMNRRDSASKLDAIGWALFFIWVGVVWLTDIGTGIGLLGIAVITLGMQGLRRINGLPVEGFWIVIGLGFAVAGVWEWTDIQQPLAPVVLIAIGVALLVWRMWPRSRRKDS